MTTDPFSDIRPLFDNEVPAAVERILKAGRIENMLSPFLSDEEVKWVLSSLSSIQSVYDFQTLISKKILEGILKKTDSSLEHTNIDTVHFSSGHLFISNHRDIVLDSAFLDLILHLAGHDTVEIAIGNNLLIEPWIVDLVRLNRSFIVKRDVRGRELLLASQKMSQYIRHAICEKKTNVWLAQREGRAKDGNDRTQTSVLKMLSLGNRDISAVDAFKELNMIPIAISYEYDPCDVLKAVELYLQSIGEQYQKTPQDDLLSMKFGLLGLRGRVSYGFAGEIDYESLNLYQNAALLTEHLAERIDEMIFKNMKLFPSHYMSWDSFHKCRKYSHKYNEQERTAFEGLIDWKINTLVPSFSGNIDFRMQVYRQYAQVLDNVRSVRIDKDIV